MVSSLSRQGRNQPRLSVAGIPGSTSTALVGREPSGLPKSGTGCVLPLPFQSAKYFRTCCSNILGSPSPAIEITTFSGRYQRSCKDCRVLAVADCHVFVVPIGLCVASGCPAQNCDHVSSATPIGGHTT